MHNSRVKTLARDHYITTTDRSKSFSPKRFEQSPQNTSREDRRAHAEDLQSPMSAIPSPRRDDPRIYRSARPMSSKKILRDEIQLSETGLHWHRI